MKTSARVSLVRNYLALRFQLEIQNIGTVPLQTARVNARSLKRMHCSVVVVVVSERIVDHFAFGGK